MPGLARTPHWVEDADSAGEEGEEEEDTTSNLTNPPALPRNPIERSRFYGLSILGISDFSYCSILLSSVSAIHYEPLRSTDGI